MATRRAQVRIDPGETVTCTFANTKEGSLTVVVTATNGNSTFHFTSQALGSFADTLKAGEATASSAMTGGADPHALVEALAASELAVETAVTLRDKVVEAYQEILRMPV